MSADKAVEQRCGSWFEEFELGVRYPHRPGRTITEADNVLFTTPTMNTQALHLDAAFSDAQPPFHQRLMFTLSTLVGLSVAQLAQGNSSSATSASPRIALNCCSTATPLYAATVMPTSAVEEPAGEGIVTFAHRNQHRRCRRDGLAWTMVRQSDRRRAGLMALSPTWDRPGCSARRTGPNASRRRAAADVVIPRLEDGVAARDRESARAALVASRLIPSHRCASTRPPPPPPTRDLEAVARTPHTSRSCWHKTESADQVRPGPWTIVVLVETPSEGAGGHRDRAPTTRSPS